MKIKYKEIINNEIQNVLKEKNIAFIENKEEDIQVIINNQNSSIESLYFEIDTDRDIIVCTASTNIEVNKYLRKEFAIIISVINYFIYSGSYDFDVESGELNFRLTTSIDTKKDNSFSIHRMIDTVLRLSNCYYEIIVDFLVTQDFSSCLSNLPNKWNDKNAFSQDDYQIFKELISFVETLGVRHKNNNEKLKISFDILGDDVPMSFDIIVNKKNQSIVMESIQPFTSRSKKKKELAYATCIVSNLLVDGSFSYDWMEDRIVFRITNFHENQSISFETLAYMLSVSLKTVEQFNDIFLDLNKGNIKIKDFVELVNSL